MKLLFFSAATALLFFGSIWYSFWAFWLHPRIQAFGPKMSPEVKALVHDPLDPSYQRWWAWYRAAKIATMVAFLFALAFGVAWRVEYLT